MSISDIREAGSNLPELVERAIRGEDVLIARAGMPVVRLVPIAEDDSPRVGGQWRGRVAVAADFDDLPDDLAGAFGVLPG